MNSYRIRYEDCGGWSDDQVWAGSLDWSDDGYLFLMKADKASEIIAIYPPGQWHDVRCVGTDNEPAG